MDNYHLLLEFEKNMSDINSELNDRDYERLIQLVESGRKYHYRNFIFASLVFVFLLKDENENFNMILEVELPIKIIMVFLYFLTIVYTVITIDIYSSTHKVIRTNFNGRIPFNWFVLTGKQTTMLSGLFIVLPLIISYIGIGFSKIPIDKGSLFYLGLFGTFLPKYLKDYAFNLSRKVDDNGNEITLSIYLLYWYRLIRGIITIALFAIPIFYFFNQDRQPKTIEELFDENIYLWVCLLSLIILRILGEIFHKKINNIGTKYGFPREYKKY